MNDHQSSARTTAQAGDAQRWRAHPVAARLLRLTISIGPLAAAFLVAGTVGKILDQGDSLESFLVWLGCVVVVSLATVTVMDRFLQDLLPLVALLKLSLAFPGEAVPSRVRFALRTGTARQLEKRLDAGELGRGEDEAAQTLLTLLTVLRDHDRLTRGHSERVRAYASLIGEELELSDVQRDRLNWGALVHDVGKLAVAPEILSKDGKPNAAEWEALRGHPAAAESLVAPVRGWLGEWANAATEHHERWDGGGYPKGLAGEQISLAGRIVAVADAFDVMTSTRSYKAALSVDDALAELTRNAGSQFDPNVVRAFLAVPPRRIRLAMGAVGWMGNLSFIGEASTIAGSGAAATTAASAVATAAALATVVTPSFDFLEQEAEPSPWAAGAQQQDAAREVDGLPPLPPGVAPPSTTIVVQTTSTAPGATTTVPSSGSPTTTTGSTGSTTTTTTTTEPAGPMVANDDAYTITRESFTPLSVQDNDVPGSGKLDPFAMAIIQPPTLGTATVQGLTIRYTPLDDESSGTDRIVYRSCDESGSCDTATVTLTLALEDEDEDEDG